MLIAGNTSMQKGMYFAQGKGNGTNSFLSLVRSDTPVKLSNSQTQRFGATNIPTDSTGIKDTLVYKLTMNEALTLLANLHATLRFVITSTSVGTPQGRLNLDIFKNGSSAGFTKINGSTRSLSAANGTVYSENFGSRIQTAITFAAGDTLDIRIEIEVTTASGSGGSTGQYDFRIDPAASGFESYVSFLL